ncbi:MAG: hypothetical protein AAFN50_09990 [Pseudomonadota bacterium]
MTNVLTRFWTAGALAGFLFLGACAASEPMLESKHPTPPGNVDLSGQWQLRETGDARRRPKVDNNIEIPTRAASRQRVAQPRPKVSSVHLFLEYGTDVKVTQTPYSMFISYDRAIVEEYTFGENRLISVGPIEAKRVSGWNGESFVVETLDRERSTLYETWSLRSPNVLQRDVRIVEREEEVFRLQQLFDRG